MNDKIIQIIPAPPGLWARHISVDEGEGFESISPIVCFALVEGTHDGFRYVRPMSMCSDGSVDFTDDCGDFDEVFWKEVEADA